jgi:hypothetical protein
MGQPLGLPRSARSVTHRPFPDMRRERPGPPLADCTPTPRAVDYARADPICHGLYRLPVDARSITHLHEPGAHPAGPRRLIAPAAPPPLASRNRCTPWSCNRLTTIRRRMSSPSRSKARSSIADHMVIAFRPFDPSGHRHRAEAGRADQARRLRPRPHRRPARRRLGAGRCGRRRGAPVPSRSAQLLQPRTDVGLRRQSGSRACAGRLPARPDPGARPASARGNWRLHACM